MIFIASADRSVKIITIATTLLFAVTLTGLVALFAAGEYYISSILFLLISATYIGCYLFRITAYELTSDQLIIHRPFRNKIIAISEILSVQLPEKEALRWTIRTFGNGGLFGYYGKFSNTKIGAMSWYASRRSGMVLLRMKSGRKILITPDDPQQFVDELPAKHIQ